MPDSLLFDGVDDYIRFNAGSALGGDASNSVVVIAKLVADEAAYKQFLGLNAIDSIFGTNNASPHNLAWFPGTGSAPISSLTTPASDGWCVYAFTAAASGSYKFHKYVYDTDTWTHESGATTQSNTPSITDFWIARTGDGQSYLDANVLIAGWWDGDLSDATVETLAVGLPAWIAATPKEAWRFDRTSAISAFVGTSTEQARVGTTLDVGDAPDSWSDSVSTRVSYKRFPRPKLRR